LYSSVLAEPLPCDLYAQRYLIRPARASPKQKIRPLRAVEGVKNKRKTQRPAARWPSTPAFTAALRGWPAGADWKARSIFLLRTRAGFVACANSSTITRLGPPGATTFPRIWIRSINACKNPVKRKTQNIVAFFDSVSICSGSLSFRCTWRAEESHYPPAPENTSRFGNHLRKKCARFVDDFASH
jgi:hypothetical protein